MFRTSPLFVQGIQPQYRSFGRTGGAFAFTDIAGCQLLLDASQTGLSNGDPVSTFVDGSGQGNDHTASGSQRPTLNSSGAFPFLDYDGSQYMTGPVAISGTTMTIFSIFKMPSDADAFSRIISLGNVGSPDFNSASFCNISRNNTNEAVRGERNSASLGGTSITYNTWYLISLTFDGSDCTVRVSGLSPASNASVGTFSIDASRIGSHLTSGNIFKGGMALHLIYDSALDSTNRGLVEAKVTDMTGIIP